MANKPTSISALTISGFKSIAKETRVEIAPLTILAGANSAGKSSVMQPLLLLKQTLEAPGDPGALLLDGPNVRFTSTGQLLSTSPVQEPRSFSVEIHKTNGESLKTTYQQQNDGFDVSEMVYIDKSQTPKVYRHDLEKQEILKNIPDWNVNVSKVINSRKLIWSISRDRCFLLITAIEPGESKRNFFFLDTRLAPAGKFVNHIRSILHLPGLRGNPQRTYPRRATENLFLFPGTFDQYVASLVFNWQINKDDKLDTLGKHLKSIGLSWKVKAEKVSDTEVELKVGRLPHSRRGGANDLVSIADVGLGVSQSLPVLVSLLAAMPGQLVYLEQPEIHLHPKAQIGLASLLCEAANRGVRVVVETHSSLLLRQLQMMVALENFSPRDIKLHWFHRDDQGITNLTTAELDENGAYGQWPEDFGDTELRLEQRYLDAVENRGVSRK
ncbi:MAG: AAA family ATPase [Phycisphaerales bacterium]|nr:AAA family ATPase [Phycisphaerales bacterium]